MKLLPYYVSLLLLWKPWILGDCNIHTVQVCSLKVGTEIPEKQRKKIRKFLCRFMSWRPSPGATEAGGALWEDLELLGEMRIPPASGSPWSEAAGAEEEGVCSSMGRPSLLPPLGKEDHWGDSKEDEVVWGGDVDSVHTSATSFNRKWKLPR